MIATGEQYSVRDFVERAFSEIGVSISWKGKGVKEKGIVSKISNKQRAAGRKTTHATLLTSYLEKGDVVVQIDPRYFRPTEVETLLRDASKARKKLGWKPEISFKQLVSEMVSEDLKEAEKDYFCKGKGFKVMRYHE